MFSKFSVKKPFTVAVAVILIIVLGFVSFTSMSTDLLPSMDLPYVVAVTTYPGASPEKVESVVTKPLEQTLATTSNIKEINSVSSENSSMIILEFNQGTNMDSAMIEMNASIDLLKAQWDDTVGAPMLIKINPDMMPVMLASIDKDGLSVSEISTYAEEKIIPQLESIEGVASVNAMGLVEEQIQVILNQSKIDSLNKKVLESVDGELAEAQTKLDDAKAEIESGKKKLDAESKKQSQKLAEATVQLTEGKAKLEAALGEIESGNEKLNQSKILLQLKKAALEEAFKLMEEAGQTPTAEQLGELETTNEQLKEIEKQIEALPATKKGLEKQLKELKKQQKTLEQGKIIMSTELAKASTSLNAGEATLNEQIALFETQRDEALKKASIDGIITQKMLSGMLTAQNFSMPAGYIKEGNDSFIVKVGEQFKEKSEIENLVLMDMGIDAIAPVKLSDVADVISYNNADEMYAKINGNNGVILVFEKQSTSSTSEVAKKLRETFRNIENENEGVHITQLMDQGVYIDIVINSVLQNLLLGGLLAIAILLLFLRDIKPTIIVALSIPISLMFAVVLMYFSGVTLNIISLSGLALGVGMLVDNSIVVIENIYRLRNKGVPAAKAAVQGATQVVGAISASTLTTICVFLPIVFTKGISRELFTDMGLTIAYSLIASLIIAITLVPATAATIMKNVKPKKHKIFDAFTRVYTKMLGGALKVKPLVLLLAVALLVYSCYAAVSMGTSFIPETESTQMSLIMTMNDKESTFNETTKTADTVVERLLTIEEIKTVGAMESSGMSMMAMSSSSSAKSVSMYIILDENKKRTTADIEKDILAKTGDLDCDIQVSGSNMDMSAMGGAGIAVEVKGNDLEKITAASKDIAEILEGVEGTQDVSDGIGETSIETMITVDKKKAIEYGLTVAQVYSAVSAEIKDRTTATTVTIDNTDYPVVVVNAEEKAVTRKNVGDIILKGTKDNAAAEVKLSEIAEITQQDSLQSIKRNAQKRYLSVTAMVDNDHNIGLVSRAVEDALAKYEVPDGIEVEVTGENETINDALIDLVKMIALAILFIYLIMVAQFQSLLSPFIVMFTIPLAFTGGMLALVITGKELSIIAMLGFLVLSGVVVNNGIVFVDCVNQLREGGMEKKEAIKATGAMRIRPILMTAMTTIFGLVTMAMGIGQGADMVQPMAITTIGGLAYATLLTLFVVPVLYDLFNRKERRVVDLENDNEPDGDKA